MGETVSVIIPAYNSEKFIGQSVASVLAQELLPDEIIIVDDGSEDGTGEIVQKLIAGQQGQKPRIKYILQANQGPAVARNTGIKNAEGDYIAFLDADDQWLPARLKKQMAIFRTRPEVGLVCSGRFRIEEATGRKTIDCKGSKLSDDSYRDLWTQGDYVVTSSVLARKKCFDAVGGFDEDPRVLGCEDAEMWLRVAEKFPIVYVNEPLVAYLVRPEGFNRSNIERSYAPAFFIIKKYEPEFLCRYSDATSIMQKKRGRVYRSWGLALFNNEQFKEARAKFLEARRHGMNNSTTNLYLLLTIFPTFLLKFLKKIVANKKEQPKNSNSRMLKGGEKQFIDEVAKKYDNRNIKSYSDESSVYDQKRFVGVSGEFLIKSLDDQLKKNIEPEFVLDVATGTGRIPISLSPICKRIIGVDLTLPMIQQAKSKMDREGLTNVYFIAGNGRQLPFKSNSFSSVVCIRFFHLIPFELQQLFLDEFYRCVRPGGKLIVEFNNPFCNFGLELLRSHKFRRGIRTMIWPWRIVLLNRKYKIKKTVGVMLPFHLKIKSCFPSIYEWYTKLSEYSLFKYFSRFILVVFEKDI